MNTNAKRWTRGVLGVWIVTTTMAHAQTTPILHGLHISASSIGQAPSAGSRREAEELMRRARAAMKDGDLTQARWCLERVEKMGVRYEGLLHRFSDTPDKLRRDLAKMDPSLPARGSASAASSELPGAPSNEPLGLPPNLPSNELPTNEPRAVAQGLPVPTDAPRGAQMVINPFAQGPNSGLSGGPGGVRSNPAPVTASPAAAKTHATQLLAMAQAALARGDIARAEQLALQARSLGLPDTAFGPGETRPWMLLLQIDRAKRQESVVTADGAQPSAANTTVRQAVLHPSDLTSGSSVQRAAGQDALEDAGQDVGEDAFPETTLQGVDETDPFAPPLPAPTQVDEADTETESPDTLPSEAVSDEETTIDPAPPAVEQEPTVEAPPSIESAVDSPSDDPYVLIQQGEQARKNREIDRARECFEPHGKKKSRSTQKRASDCRITCSNCAWKTGMKKYRCPKYPRRNRPRCGGSALK